MTPEAVQSVTVAHLKAISKRGFGKWQGHMRVCGRGALKGTTCMRSNTICLFPSLVVEFSGIAQSGGLSKVAEMARERSTGQPGGDFQEEPFSVQAQNQLVLSRP